MKVIKEGNNKPKWSRQVECTGDGNPCTDGCGAVLEVTREDLRYFPGTDSIVIRPNAVIMKCPCCNGITDLDRDDWPQNFTNLTKFTTAWRDDRVSG